MATKKTPIVSKLYEDGDEHVLVGKLDLEALRVPQGPYTGINAIIGKWPGDESDEEIQALLEELS